MRMMLRMTPSLGAGNKSAKKGTLGDIIGELTRMIKPEATYFVAEDGRRTAYFFFDMADASHIPAIAEPLFTSLNAKVEFFPAMNQQDLERGLEAWGQRSG